MNKPTHTPGPWEVAQRPCNGSNQVWPVATGEGRICTVMDGSRSNANAKLIAAAPDLLAAIQDILAITDRKHFVWDAAHAALKKAGAE